MRWRLRFQRESVNPSERDRGSVVHGVGAAAAGSGLGHRLTAVAVFLDRLTAEPSWRDHLMSVASDLVAFATDNDAPPPHLPFGHE
jgi:hypothetical protein